jgi:branched-chain amino acid transport system permease protein
LATAFVIYLRHSNFGMSLLALRDDPVSASMSGIPVLRIRTLAWLVSAFMAGVVGATYGWHISVFYPNSVFNLTISIFAIVFTLFGGRATAVGPLVGTVLLYGVYTFIGVSSPQYFQLIYGLLIVALVLFLPRGVVSLFTRIKAGTRKQGGDVLAQ